MDSSSSPAQNGPVLVARFSHETNTFIASTTPRESFFDNEQGTPLQGMRRVLRERGREVHVSCCWTANPSGPVDDDFWTEKRDAILADAARVAPAIVLLDLHGALVTTRDDDAEGTLLEMLRAKVGKKVLIGVALDLHGNLSRRMVEHADVMMGYETYPHVDMVETGERVARYVLDLKANQRPHKMLIQLPVLVSTLRSRTDIEGTMQTAVAQARSWEEEKTDSVSVFAGFPISDIENAGMSLIFYTFRSPAQLQASAHKLAVSIWSQREGLVYTPEPMLTSLARAQQLANDSGFVLILDHGDNVFSGAAASTTTVAKELLKLDELNPYFVGPICDASVVAKAWETDRGPFTFNDGLILGESTIVARKTNGRFVVRGKILQGATIEMGRCVLLRVPSDGAKEGGGSLVAVSERPVEPFDRALMDHFGLQDFARQFRAIVLKSRVYCRPEFEPLAAHVVEVDSLGPTTSDYSFYAFKRLRRPIFPLETEVEWDANVRESVWN